MLPSRGLVILFWLIFGILTQIRCYQTKVNYRQKEKEVLDTILNQDVYDARIRPSGHNDTDGPAIVAINLFIRSIATISDVNMQYSVQLTFREQWIDERLKFDDYNGKIKYLTLTEADRVWRPDLFFSNEKSGHFHTIIMPNVYIRIHPHGSVLYSVRITLTLSCPMNLKLYPLDRQVCSLKMASYGWTTNDLIFMWKEGDPVQVVKNLHLPRFTLERYRTDNCNSKTNTDNYSNVGSVSDLFGSSLELVQRNTLQADCPLIFVYLGGNPQRDENGQDMVTFGIVAGEYSCLKVDLFFKREFGYYLIQIYIPCCMLVIVSWVSFWLDPGAVPARVSLGVMTLLTMATQTSSINASLPPVSYTKAIDVWTGVCLTFVFGALLEFALVNYASRSDIYYEKLKKQARVSKMEHGNTFGPKPLINHSGHVEMIRHCEAHMQHSTGCWCFKSWMSKFPTRSKRIDVVSRIIFPVVFALFNISYWSTYLLRDEQEEH